MKKKILIHLIYCLICITISLVTKIPSIKCCSSQFKLNHLSRAIKPQHNTKLKIQEKILYKKTKGKRQNTHQTQKFNSINHRKHTMYLKLNDYFPSFFAFPFSVPLVNSIPKHQTSIKKLKLKKVKKKNNKFNILLKLDALHSLYCNFNDELKEN